MIIDKNCIINGMPEKAYHDDPTPMEAEGFKVYSSLSSTVALTMLEQSEIEARMKIKRFNPNKEEEASTDAVNLGSLAHDKVLLGSSGKNLYEIIPFKDFRTADAKDRRDDLVSRGIIPLADNQKTKDLLQGVNDMEARLREQLAEHREYPDLMKKGAGEQSGFYFDEKTGIWKRARFDWLDEAYPDIVWDYKTTALSIQQWINQELWKEKYIQPPHYSDVLSGVLGKPCRFGFIVQRTVEPYLVHIVVIDESFIEEVRNRYDSLVSRFANCLKTDTWRGAPRYTIHACPPPWILTKWESEELNDAYEKHLDSEEEKRQQDVSMAG